MTGFTNRVSSRYHGLVVDPLVSIGDGVLLGSSWAPLLGPAGRFPLYFALRRGEPLEYVVSP